MQRFIAGVVSALLLVTAGVFIWRAQAERPVPLAAAPLFAAPPDDAADAATPDQAYAELAPPPAASEKTREQKRFDRYDRDKNGAVAQNEYLYSRQRAFARIDRNGDGRISFDEYAAKALTKFAAADRDRNGQLNAGEFATTRVVRKSRPRPNCAPVRAPRAMPPGNGEGDSDEG